MPSIRDLQDSEEFGKLSPEGRTIAFDRMATVDADFQRLSPEAQKVVRQRLVGAAGQPSAIAQFFEPTLRTGGRVVERLRESGEAVLGLPSLIKKFALGEAQGGLSDVVTGTAKPVTAGDVGWTALRALGAPFEPIFAPIGESIRTAAEEFVSPETARTVGAVGEMAAGVGLPFVRVPATPVTRGLTKVGIGRLSEEAVALDRALATRPSAEILREPVPPTEILPPSGPAVPGITEVARDFRALQAEGRQLSEQIGTLERAGLPVPRQLRQAYEDILLAMRGPEAKPAVPEVLRRAMRTEVPPPEPPTAPSTPEAPPVAPESKLPIPAPIQAVVSGGESLPPLMDPILSLPTHRQILGAAEELFTRVGVPRDPKKLISDQIMELLGAGRLRLPDLDATLQQHGLTFTELANGMFRPAIRDAARRLGYLGALQKRIGTLLAEGGEAAKAEAGQLLDFATTLDEGVKAQSWWRRADNIRRGLLVTQLSTAVRNFETQVGRVGLDVLQQGLDAGLQRVFTPSNATVHPADGFATLLNLFRRGTKATTNQILSAFPREYDRMFSTYASDIANKAKQSGVVLRGADAAFSNVEQAVGVLNTANKFQEWIVRRAVFQAKLDQALRAKGQDLTRLIAENTVGGIDPADIKTAVDAALETTFAKSPQYGSLGQKFISLVNAMPGATLALPFPRFFVNSLKFFGDFSPYGFLKLLSPTERAAVASGNMQTISRATIGSAMLGAAYQFRTSEHAGERWYEAKLPSGKTIDLRPFNPFAAYLFTADVAKRYKEGTLTHLSSYDIFQGILSSNLRAGTGLFVVDTLLSGLTELGDINRATRSLKELAGETAGGFLVPLQQITDILSEFDQSLRTVRETRTEPFTGPIKSRIPGLAQTLPERELATRASPPERQAPALKQATGILLNPPKNPLEKELDRLGFTPQEILASTGDREADRLVAQKMGPLSERVLAPIMTRPEYQSLTDPAKGVVLRKLLTRVGSAARELAEAEYPALFGSVRLQRLPVRERMLIRERVPEVLKQAIGAGR